MAADQKNFKWYQYIDDSGREWAVRADAAWGDNAASGLAAFDPTNAPFGPESARHRTRKVMYRDPSTFRTYTQKVGTAAAFAAAPATFDVHVPGIVGLITYNLAAKIGEKLQIAQVARNAIDHA